MKLPPLDQQSEQPLGLPGRKVLKFDPSRKQASAARRQNAPRIKVVPHPNATPAPFRNPLDVAMLETLVMTDCTVEATLTAGPTKREGQEVCVLFGYQDEQNYYFVHLGNMAAGHINQLYCMRDGVPATVPVKYSVNTTWQPNTEHRLRVERTVRDGMVRVYFDDLSTPVLEALDHTFERGKVGLGTFGADLKLQDVQVKGVRARNFQRPTVAALED